MSRQPGFGQERSECQRDQRQQQTMSGRAIEHEAAGDESAATAYEAAAQTSAGKT